MYSIQLKEYINKFVANLQNGDRKLLEARLESLTSVDPKYNGQYDIWIEGAGSKSVQSDTHKTERGSGIKGITL
jgi:hypothetical protein